VNIIDALIGEHAAVITVLNHLEKFQVGWELRQYHEACDLLEELLATHACLEDELLFDPITPESGRLAEALHTLSDEHRELRHLVSDLKHSESVPEARRLLNRLIEVTRDHFAVEERVLFGLAADVLGAKQLERLGEEWALRRRVGFAL
jgi:hemerythrin-like domain-containing protein